MLSEKHKDFYFIIFKHLHTDRYLYFQIILSSGCVTV